MKVRDMWPAVLILCIIVSALTVEQKAKLLVMTANGFQKSAEGFGWIGMRLEAKGYEMVKP